MNIRHTIESDTTDILRIHTLAFGQEKGPEIADLVRDLMTDPTALPMLSLAAVENEQLIGHILYTKVDILPSAEGVSCSILAPLAILPDFQKKTVGQKLINKGLAILKEKGVDLVFVLGHPEYYPRCGFTPAGRLGFQAPYPIPEEHSDAWMVQELRPNVLEKTKGTIQCAKVLNRPEHWRE